MTWSKLLSGLAVTGAGIALLIKGETTVGVALVVAGAAEMGATIVVPT